MQRYYLSETEKENAVTCCGKGFNEKVPIKDRDFKDILLFKS